MMEILSNFSEEIRVLIILLAISNLLGIVVVLWDKSSVSKSGSGVPTSVLLITALLGGTPGIILGLKICHHSLKSGMQMLLLAAVLLIQIFLVGHYKEWIVNHL